MRTVERDLELAKRAASLREVEECRDAEQEQRRLQGISLRALGELSRAGAVGAVWRAANAGVARRIDRVREGRTSVERAERIDAQRLDELREAETRRAGLERVCERRADAMRTAEERRQQRELDERSAAARARRRTGVLALCLALFPIPFIHAEASAESCTDDVGVARLLEDIRARQLHLERREREVADRSERIDELERLVELRLDEVAGIANAVEERIAGWEDANEAKSISKLAKIYGKMDPQKAASLLEDLDLDLATRIVAKMKPKESAALLPLLSGRRAVSMSRNVAHPLGGSLERNGATP